MYWKLYQIYKSAGSSSKKIGFFWFSFYAQDFLSFGHLGPEILRLPLPEQVQLQNRDSMKSREARVLGGNSCFGRSPSMPFIAIMEKAYRG